MIRPVRKLGIGTAAVLVLATVLYIGWSNIAVAEPLPYVNLHKGDLLPAIAQAEVTPLRLAIAAVISPQDTVESYSDLAVYLGQKLDRPVELVQRRTYAEINDLIERGEVDLAFVCTSAYVIGQRDFGMQLLAAPQMNGETVYFSWLIVKTDSPAQDMADMRGKTFAFTDPWSNSGRIYPTYLVDKLGETPERFFGRHFFTYSHDDAIRAVASGVADGAAVDSLVYQYAVAREPHLGEVTKIIHRSPPFGIPPVVTSPELRPLWRAKLQNTLLEMADDPDGRTALEGLEIDRFVVVEDSIYDSARDLEKQVNPVERR